MMSMHALVLSAFLLKQVGMEVPPVSYTHLTDNKHSFSYHIVFFPHRQPSPPIFLDPYGGFFYNSGGS